MKLWKHFRPKSSKSSEKTTDNSRDSSASVSTDSGQQSGVESRPHTPLDEQTGVSKVELQIDAGASLGIILQEGGSGRSQLCPSIRSLRSGSVADKSDALAAGDRVAGVNGVRTAQMRHEEVSRMLDNVAERAVLDIEYALPAAPACMSVSSRVTQVTLTRDAGSLGFTLRGGSNPDPMLSRPLTVTQVRPGGPADRDGTIKAGDRLVAINGTLLQSATLMDAQRLLQQSQNQTHCILAVEYDVSLLDSVRHATGPLLVEIEHQGAGALGITLADAEGKGSWISRGSQDGEVSGCVVVSSIAPGRTADRCGALHVGDQILGVDETRVEGTTMSARDVTRLLDTPPRGARGVVTLEILPLSQANRGWRVSDEAARSRGFLRYAATPSPTDSSSMTGLHRRGSTRTRSDSSSSRARTDLDSFHAGNLSHCETICLTLTADVQGYGLTATDEEPGVVVVAAIEQGSPVDRCGCVQVGDRILSANHKADGLTGSDVNGMVNNFGGLTLEVEFPVADAVVPSSGVFSVKLAKRGNGLGITVTAVGDGGAVISAVRRGSVAHRSGALAAGDKLLAVDSRPVARATLRETRTILQRCADVVTLRVQKEDRRKDVSDGHSVVYTVELTRDGGSLGVTLAGSEDCVEPIVIASLTPGGLAELTGALHEGDRLLAINGNSLRGKPLSAAVSLLHGSGDSVTMKISRSRSAVACVGADVTFVPALPSVDSAVESWDSQRPPSGGGGDNHFTDFHPATLEAYSTESATVRRRLRTTDECAAGWRSLDSLDAARAASHAAAAPWETAHSVDSEQPVSPISDCSDCSLPDGRRESYDARITPPLDYFDEAPSPLPLPPYLRDGRQSQPDYEDVYLDEDSTTTSSQLELYQVTLFKDAVYEDFGFSVSDGLYERGVYVNRVRKGGPADMSVTLKPFDRILQVNDTRTHDFDCCLTVPLIASAGEKLELTIARNNHAYPGFNDTKDFDAQDLPWVQKENGSCTNRSITSSATKTL